MDLIATHISADFDAVASVLAARRLHPEAAVFFPGSREESVRRMLEAGVMGELDELRQRDIEPREIDRLILCDVRQRERIGVVAGWLEDHPDIEVIAYDHHPDTASDVSADGGIIDPEVGSTSTLMIEEFSRRGIEPDPEEATVLLMGIYEDTGSLRFPTTTPRDLTAAARLLEHGAELDLVRRFAVDRLDAERLEILHAMTRELAVFRIHDHRVGLVALELGEYVDELAPLVNRLAGIFELELLFAIFGEEDRASLIARGEVPGVHLGELLAEFADGGGHATAAAARVKGWTPLETREELLGFLARRLPPAVLARDLMVTTFTRLERSTTVEEAKARLVERRINAAPVVDPEVDAEIGGRPVGAVSRQILDAALQHGLGSRPVETVMRPELVWVSPGAPADELAERILDRQPRFVLVGEEPRAEGLVTRMDVMRHLYGRLSGEGESIDERSVRQPREVRQIGHLLYDRLAPDLATKVEAAARVSRRLEAPVHVVGGLVRDLLLDRPNRDLDLVVEGDGIELARQLAAELGGHSHAHEPFMTAVVVAPDEVHVDVATARSEFYRAPAALPEVESSTLRQDLYRRDFTVNTLAVRIGPEPTPALIDYFGGRQDLEARTLRVLHSLSFVDDPTRVLRAVRLEVRLGFSMSPETLHLVEVALAEGVFDQLSGGRLRDELVLLLAEPDVARRGIERLEELGLLGVLHPELALDGPTRERLSGVHAAHDWYTFEGVEAPPVIPWQLFLLALVADLPRLARQALAGRLILAGEVERRIIEGPERLAGARRLLVRRDVAPHRVAATLEPLSGEELLLLMAEAGECGRRWVRRYLTTMRPLELAIRGQDLLDAGHEPGPAIGGALAATRRARLDGAIGVHGELEYALDWLAEHAGDVEPETVGGAS